MSTAPTAAERPPVDVRDMLVVHTAMLREFRLAPAAVMTTAPGDRRRAVAVGGHLAYLVDLLHHHHEGEDELLWPKLRDRTLPDAVAAIEEAEAQHADLDAALSQVRELRAVWVADPESSRRDPLATELRRLHGLLSVHLDLEETRLLPLAARVLTTEEWRAIGEAGMAALPKSVLPLTFGMLAYEADPAVLTEMLRLAPPVPRTLLPLIAPRIYARRARRIHGTTRP